MKLFLAFLVIAFTFAPTFAGASPHPFTLRKNSNEIYVAGSAQKKIDLLKGYLGALATSASWTCGRRGGAKLLGEWRVWSSWLNGKRVYFVEADFICRR